MEADSQLNVCHEHGDVTNALRKQLWAIHTRAAQSQQAGVVSNSSDNIIYSNSIGDDMGKAYFAWKQLMDKSKSLKNSKKQSPIASLVGFLTATAKRSTLD
jgi:hypothetical protein